MNKYIPHLTILCEDKATYDLALGFQLAYLSESLQTNIYVEKDYVRGYRFQSVLEDRWLKKLNSNKNQFILLVMDFDNTPRENKTHDLMKFLKKNEIEQQIFFLGCKNEPEDLKKLANNLLVKNRDKATMQNVGKALFYDCRNNTQKILWGSEHLAHNAKEVSRLLDTLVFLKCARNK